MNKKKSSGLSNSEEMLMHLFWRENRPLTSTQIVKLSDDTNWGGNYVHKLLGMLQEKGYIQMCGVTQEGKHYSRQFIPCLDKEQYITNLLEKQGVSPTSFAKIAVALVKKESGDKADAKNEQMIKELEEMVEQFKAEQNGKKA